MSKVDILFFAADPHYSLRLNEDVRRIHQKVRAAEYRDTLNFDLHLAARTDDLMQALYQTRPQVVHFSGHGNSKGLVMVSDDGTRPQSVSTSALKKLFEVFPGDIRLVVLNACMSLPQARAIADVVGCAIGTRGSISDQAAITFGAAFYRALAFGQSVKAAYDQAVTALALEHKEFRNCPVLVARPGVNPAEIILVSADNEEQDTKPPPPSSPPPLPSPSSYRRWIGVATTAVALASGSVYMLVDVPAAIGSCDLNAAVAPSAGAGPLTLKSAPAPNAGVGGSPKMEEVENAKDLYEAGNYAAALPLFERAAEEGNAEAIGWLGVMLLNGQGTARDTVEAMRLLRKAAGKRDPHAMHQLAGAYERGNGAKQSDRWAMYWYRKAAGEQKYPPSMISLGRMYSLGQGVPADRDEALRWFEKARAAGSVDAMVEAGIVHQRGLAGGRDAREAFRLYCEAAKAGSSRGMFAIGLMYENGDGVPREDEEARSWYQKGANAGSPQAMNNLGVLYATGQGVQQSSEKAIEWFRRAAEKGHAVAQANLAALLRGERPDSASRLIPGK